MNEEEALNPAVIDVFVVVVYVGDDALGIERNVRAVVLVVGIWNLYGRRGAAFHIGSFNPERNYLIIVARNRKLEGGGVRRAVSRKHNEHVVVFRAEVVYFGKLNNVFKRRVKVFGVFRFGALERVSRFDVCEQVFSSIEADAAHAVYFEVFKRVGKFVVLAQSFDRGETYKFDTR